MTNQKRSWRDVIKIHPAADVFPLLGDDDLRALADDIKANGLHVAPIVYEETSEDEDGREVTTTWLIDGRNRLDAMELLGWDVVDWDEYDRGGEAKVVIEAMTGVAIEPEVVIPEQQASHDVSSLVVATNIRRRHLTKRQQASLIVKAVKAGEPWQAERTGVVGQEPSDRGSQNENVDPDADRSFNPTPGKKGGSTKGVRGKAIEVARRHGISKGTVDRAIAEQDGKRKKKKTAGRAGQRKTQVKKKTSEPDPRVEKKTSEPDNWWDDAMTAAGGIEVHLGPPKLVGHVRPDGKGFRRAGGNREQAWGELNRWAEASGTRESQGTVALLRFAEGDDVEHQIVLRTSQGWWALSTADAGAVAQGVTQAIEETTGVAVG